MVSSSRFILTVFPLRRVQDRVLQQLLLTYDYVRFVATFDT